MGFPRKKGCNVSKWKKGLAITAGSFTFLAAGASLAGGNDQASLKEGIPGA
jgi:hypothetical protein